MTPPPIVLFLALLLAPAPEVTQASDVAALRELLDQFLAGASRDDAATHQRFWAEDLIYTGSSGRRLGKADILREVRAPSSEPGPGAGELPLYTAEEVRIQQYGDAAVVAFRLVGTTRREGKPHVSRYLNTGTFLKRDGQWRAVAWQATRIPRTEEEAKAEVTLAESRLRQALAEGNARTLESLLDDGFVRSDGLGGAVTRKELVEALASGQLKYVELHTAATSITIHGDAAVVHGVSRGQRTTDSAPFSVPYTLILVDRGEGWRAVALH